MRQHEPVSITMLASLVMLFVSAILITAVSVVAIVELLRTGAL